MCVYGDHIVVHSIVVNVLCIKLNTSPMECTVIIFGFLISVKLRNVLISISTAWYYIYRIQKVLVLLQCNCANRVLGLDVDIHIFKFLQFQCFGIPPSVWW